MYIRGSEAHRIRSPAPRDTVPRRVLFAGTLPYTPSPHFPGRDRTSHCRARRIVNRRRKMPICSFAGKGISVMRTVFRCSLIPLLALLSAPLTAFAQSGAELLLKPWEKGQLIEARADVIFQEGGNFDDEGFSDLDFRLTHYE